MKRTIAAVAIATLLTACGGSSDPSTKTKLDAVEVEPGSASDAMILLDDSDIDGTSVDGGSGALTAEGAAAAKAEAEAAAEDAPESEGDTATDDDAPLPEDGAGRE
jgi:hypothetical protein